MRPPGADLSAQTIARQSRSSFLVSFAALEPHRRRGLVAVYAFCRVVDDAADRGESRERTLAELQFWRDELAHAERGESQTPLGHEVGFAIRELGVATEDLSAVVDGVSMDVDGVHFETLDDLLGYCDLVASAVGLACLPVFGATGPRCRDYAMALGRALQLTNVLRDLRDDAGEQRVYAPSSLCKGFDDPLVWLRGEGPVSAYVTDGPVTALVNSLAEQAKAYFERAASMPLDPADRLALVPAEIMAAVYQEVLQKVSALGGRVCLRPRVRVPTWRKLWLARRVRANVRAAAR